MPRCKAWQARPNNSFKPNLLRYTNNMAERACHVVASATQVGLTQVLGALMSFPCSLASCSSCGSTFSSDDLYGNYMYEIGQTRIRIETSSGWCHACDAHLSIESLNVEPIEQRLRALEGEISTKPGLLQSMSSAYKNKQSDLQRESRDLQKLLFHLKMRNDGPRCLSCGGLNVEACSNKGQSCYRPGCTGTLVEDPREPIWISYAEDIRLYDMDGKLLRVEEW